MLRGDAFHQADQNVGARFRAALLLVISRDIDRHERRIEPAGLRARIIEIDRLFAARDIGAVIGDGREEL